MPPFLHLFCFAPKRNTTLTKTFVTPKSFTKGLVLLSVYIIAYFPNSHNIDFATMKYPFIGPVLEQMGNITATRNITFDYNCFVVGKACVFESGGAAFCRSGTGTSGPIIGGIPFISDSTNAQVGLCIPVAAGQTIKFEINGNAEFQSIVACQMVVS